jgi:hypothetical protein
MLSIIGTVVFCIAVFFFVASGIFRWLDVIRDREEKEKFKARIEKFWIETAEIDLTDQINRALAARYEATKNLRLRFLKLFWVICALSALVVAFEVRSQENSDDTFLQIVDLNFRVRYVVHCGYILIKEGRSESQEYCDPSKNSAGPPQLDHYRAEKVAYEEYISELKNRPFAFLAARIVSELIKILLMVIPLSLALWFSFNITLKLLSKITGSRLWYSFLVTFDLAVAVLMPPVFTSVFPLMFLGVSIFFFGQSFDLFSARSNLVASRIRISLCLACEERCSSDE